MADAPRKENLFTRRIGPLPMWGWTAIIGIVVIGWALYSRYKANQASTAASTGSSGTGAATTPGLVNQVYESPVNVNLTTPPDQDDHRTGGGGGGPPNPPPQGKCKPGYHFVAGLSVAEGSRPRGEKGPFPYPVKGGMCVPDRAPIHTHPVQPPTPTPVHHHNRKHHRPSPVPPYAHGGGSGPPVGDHDHDRDDR